MARTDRVPGFRARQPHDQRIKLLLKRYFAEFFACFLPDWHRQIDWRRVSFLEQEVFPEPPSGARKVLDLVARVRLRRPHKGGRTCLVVVHVEVEGTRSVARIGRRMQDYDRGLETKLRVPVLPIVLLLNTALDGIGIREERTFVGDFEQAVFRWIYIGLPGLDAAAYEAKSGNPWSVPLLGLMRHDRSDVTGMATQAVRRTLRLPGPVDEGKYLLLEAMQAYLLRDPGQWEKLQRTLVKPGNREVETMMLTIGERGRLQGLREGLAKGKAQGEKRGLAKGEARGVKLGEARGVKLGEARGVKLGLDKGLHQGRLEVALLLLEQRFGRVPAAVRKRVESLTAAKLRSLARMILSAESRADLDLGWK